MPKKDISMAAVIDIGSNEIKLKLGQNKKGSLIILESAVYPISIGRDTFTAGKISFEKADKACDIIKNFIKITKEYGVENIRVIATSALREAENKEYVLDQVYLKTGLSVDVINNQDEKLYINKLMYGLIDKEHKQSAMMVYIGSGNLGISVIEKEKIPFIQNIRIGSLRLTEMFEDLQEYSKEFHTVVEEYLHSFTDYLKSYIPQHIKSFIACGNEILLIADLCCEAKQGNFLNIERKKFNALYEDIKHKSVGTIMEAYNLPLEKAEQLLPAMCIYDNLLEFTDADMIISPHVYLIDSVLYEMLYPGEYAEITKSFYKNTVLCAKIIAERFGCSVKHYECVENFALKIFDKIKKIHGMGQRERILLQAAAILHDIGKIINGKGHYIHSYNIICGLDLTGLNGNETEIVACMSLYHSSIVPFKEDFRYKSLSGNDRVIVSKLSAILRMADSLDRSHNQKFDNIDVKITENELIITITTEKNIELEQWSFVKKSKFFEEVFGLKSVVKKKRTV